MKIETSYTVVVLLLFEIVTIVELNLFSICIDKDLKKIRVPQPKR
jgi:hypothetical protein